MFLLCQITPPANYVPRFQTGRAGTTGADLTLILLEPRGKTRSMKLRSLFLAVFFLWVSPGVKAAADMESLLDFPVREKIRKFELKNGLRVIVLPRFTSPTVALYIKFKVGAVDEPPHMAGTAHLLEHILFKGTKKLGTRDYEKEKKYLDQIRKTHRILDRFRLRYREAEAAGAEANQLLELRQKIEALRQRVSQLQKWQRKYIIKEHDALIYNQNGQVGFNAYTSQDVTNYQIRLPANKLELWARIESDRLRDPVFREYYKERDVVIEERRMRYESIGRRKLHEKFVATAFGVHPYRKPVIGFMSGLSFLNQEDTRRFFRTYYSPNNMVIAMVGAVTPEKAHQLVKKHFGDLPRSNIRRRVTMSEPPQDGLKRARLKYPGQEYMITGWHKPSLKTRANLVFELMSRLLTDGRNSLMTDYLVHKKRSALSVYSWNGDPGERYNNLFALFVRPLRGIGYAKLENQINEVVEKLKKGDFSEKLLQETKTKMIVDLYRNLESNGGMADNLSYFELVFSDWRFMFDYYKILANITKKDIQQTATQYMVPDNQTIATLIPVKKDKAAGPGTDSQTPGGNK